MDPASRIGKTLPGKKSKKSMSDGERSGKETQTYAGRGENRNFVNTSLTCNQFRRKKGWVTKGEN